MYVSSAVPKVLSLSSVFSDMTMISLSVSLSYLCIYLLTSLLGDD